MQPAYSQRPSSQYYGQGPPLPPHGGHDGWNGGPPTTVPPQYSHGAFQAPLPPLLTGQHSPGQAPVASPSSVGWARQGPMAGQVPAPPSASQLSVPSYNPLLYGPMPGAQQQQQQQQPHSPVNQAYPGRGSSPVYSPPPGGYGHGDQSAVQGTGQLGSDLSRSQLTQNRPFAHTDFSRGSAYGRPPDGASQQLPKPPLPPRPTSAVYQAPAQSAPQLFAHGPDQYPSSPPQNMDPSHHQQPYHFNVYGQQPYYNDPYQGSAMAATGQASPGPPTVPPGYLSEVQANQQASIPHPPYSYDPPTHRYEPSNQQGAMPHPRYSYDPPTHRYEPSNQPAPPPGSHTGPTTHYPPPPVISQPPPPKVPPKTPASAFNPADSHPPSAYHGAQHPSPTLSHTSAQSASPQPPTWSTNVVQPNAHQMAHLPGPATSQPHTSWAPTPESRQAGSLPLHSPSHSMGSATAGPAPAHPSYAPSATGSGPEQSYPPLGQRPYAGSQPGQPGWPPAGHSSPYAAQQASPGAQGPILGPQPQRPHQEAHRPDYDRSSVHQPTRPVSHPDPNHQHHHHHHHHHHHRQQGVSTESLQSPQPSAAHLVTGDGNDRRSQVGPPAYPYGAASPPPIVQTGPQMAEPRRPNPTTPVRQPPSDGEGVRRPHDQAPVHGPAKVSPGRARPPVAGIGASVLGGFGGPSDWERFEEFPEDGPSDEVPDSASLQAAHSPPERASERAGTSEGEQAPAAVSGGSNGSRLPSVPAPLHPHRSSPRSEFPIPTTTTPERRTSEAHAVSPLRREELGRHPSETDASIVSFDVAPSPSEASGTSIDTAIRAWDQSGASGTSPDGQGFIIQDTAVPHRSGSPRGDVKQATIAQGQSTGVPHPSHGHATYDSSSRIEDRRLVDAAAQDRRLPGTIALEQLRHESEQQRHPSPVQLDADLDDPARESLIRYAVVLHEESQAATVEQKVALFANFVASESRLRGPEFEAVFEASQRPPEPPPSAAVATRNPEAVAPHVGSESASSRAAEPQTRLRTTTTTTTTPPLGPEDTDEQQYSPGGRPVIRRVTFQASPEAAGQPRRDRSAAPQPEDDNRPDPPSPGANAPIPVDLEDEEHRSRSWGPNPESRHGTPAAYQSFQKPVGIKSPDRKRPSTPYRPNRDSNATIVPGSIPASPAESDRRMPSCQPLRRRDSTSGSPHAASTKTKSQSPPQADGLSLRPSGTTTGPDRRKRSSSSSSSSSSNAEGTSQDRLPSALAPGPARRDDKPNWVTALKDMLPPGRELKQSGNPALDSIQRALMAISEDFGFIEQEVKAWEADARKSRKRLQEERQQRQDEHEAHTERLYSEGHIGYGEVGEMTDEFQKDEAAREAQETELEYHSYAQRVFDPVYGKLQVQIKELMEQYLGCLDLLVKTALARQDSRKERPYLGRIIEVLLELHTHIEVRHEKVLQAISRRDRKYQEAMLRPHYSSRDRGGGGGGGSGGGGGGGGNNNNDSGKNMRGYERHFEDAAKKTKLDACATREQRANRLVQAIDQSVTRGVAEELEYMSSITRELRNIAKGLDAANTGAGNSTGISNANANANANANGTGLGTGTGTGNSKGLTEAEAAELRDDVLFAREVLEILARNAEALYRQAHGASRIGCVARYDLAVAAADVSHSRVDANADANANADSNASVNASVNGDLNANTDDAEKLRSDKFQSDKLQSDKFHSDNLQSDKAKDEARLVSEMERRVRAVKVELQEGIDEAERVVRRLDRSTNRDPLGPVVS
ncbi:MAG: hypothetical protein M1815_002212 [Lichina confinis]|nr:MAG: hypothetical protein M1815_002212 [Lichina confinis]